MRVSRALPGSEGATVLFNGHELTRCFEADDVDGWALCGIASGEISTDLAYSKLAEVQNFDGLAVMRYDGTVTIEFDTDEHRRKAEAAQ